MKKGIAPGDDMITADILQIEANVTTHTLYLLIKKYRQKDLLQQIGKKDE